MKKIAIIALLATAALAEKTDSDSLEIEEVTVQDSYCYHDSDGTETLEQLLYCVNKEAAKHDSSWVNITVVGLLKDGYHLKEGYRLR